MNSDLQKISVLKRPGGFHTHTHTRYPKVTLCSSIVIYDFSSSTRSQHLIFPELVNNWFMKEEFDVFEEVESPGSRGAFVHFLLVFGLMGINPLKDAQSPAKDKDVRQDPLGLPLHRNPRQPETLTIGES